MFFVFGSCNVFNHSMYAVALHVVRLVIALQQDTAKSSLPLHDRFARARRPPVVAHSRVPGLRTAERI